MEIWTKVIVLSIGGTLGVNARYWLGAWINRWTSPQFPWATVTINVTGSFLIGFLTVALTRWMPHPNHPAHGDHRVPGRLHDVLHVRERRADPVGARRGYTDGG